MTRRGYDLKIARAKLRRSKLWCGVMLIGCGVSVSTGISLAMQGEGLWCLCALPTLVLCASQFFAWAERVAVDMCDVRDLEASGPVLHAANCTALIEARRYGIAKCSCGGRR